MRGRQTQRRGLSMTAPARTPPKTPTSHPLYRAVGDLLRAVLHAQDRAQARTGLDHLLTLLAELGITPTPSLQTGLDAVATARFAISAREMQVLQAISDGASTAEISKALFISEDTVKSHARHIYAKLGARDRTHAVAIAFREGLLT